MHPQGPVMMCNQKLGSTENLGHEMEGLTLALPFPTWLLRFDQLHPAVWSEVFTKHAARWSLESSGSLETETAEVHDASYIYLSIHPSIHPSIYLYIYIHIYMQICMCIYILIYIYICVCVCKYIYIYICANIYIYIWGHTYIYTYIWRYIYIYFH
jgi:hypothetical protein